MKQWKENAATELSDGAGGGGGTSKDLASRAQEKQIESQIIKGALRAMRMQNRNRAGTTSFHGVNKNACG